MLAGILEFDTPHGLARARLQAANPASGMLVLGHGAGGGIQAPDLLAAGEAANELGISVALVEQPYRVAGRRNQPAANQLDAAWLAVIEQLGAAGSRELPLFVGGRSAGARVACRTAAEAQARAVLCLAFPVHPPGRSNDPTKSRLPELEAVTAPVLVIQGDRDPFGMPPDGPGRTVVRVPGDHALRNTAAVRAADWQGQGLGKVLLARLADRAREEEIQAFTALVSMGNRAMHALLGRLDGAVTVDQVGNGVAEWRVQLAPRGLGRQLEESLRAAAAGHLRLPPRLCDALRAAAPLHLHGHV